MRSICRMEKTSVKLLTVVSVRYPWRGAVRDTDSPERPVPPQTHVSEGPPTDTRTSFSPDVVPTRVPKSFEGRGTFDLFVPVLVLFSRTSPMTS